MTTEPFSSVAYTIMAALAGAVTALAFRPWKKMTGLEIALTLFVGFSFAIFVSPWVAHSIMQVPANEPRAASFITYVMGAGSNILLPRIIQFFERLLGAKGDGQ
ncbi:hypothetical protein [Sphingobium yanoikuyae]|uniref:hypothetical protein n=1 Tax=Sphingobium yanoikuyae TaxID=13690 RepID=UPI0008470383|nr:hypothetical protein [Sphingobium yanoikuyae]